MSAKGRLFLHIGLAKTGTTFLQALLADNRPALREAGFIYPFVRPEAMFHAAVEVREDHTRWGLSPAVVDGTWRALLDKAAAFDGTAILSHEILAGATADQVARVAEGLAQFELHLVVTARDLARQIPAHWQEAVKNGQTFSFAEYTREVLGEAGAPDSQLWNEQDLLAVLDRWAWLVPQEQVHLVTCPPAGADRDELWRRFAEASGVPVALGDLEAARSNESLGAAQVHLLRRVNEELGGRVGQPAYAHVVKRLFAQRLLSSESSAPAETPESLREPLSTRASEWIETIGSRGYAVHGDLSDLVPTRFGTVDPDSLEPTEVPEVPIVVATVLEEIVAARATAQADEPEGRKRFARRRS